MDIGLQSTFSPFTARFRMTPRVDQTAIQNRIRRLITEKTVTKKQQELAEMAEIQPSMMSRLLSGSELITRKYLIKIEAATTARLAWLEYGIEPVYYPDGKIPERNDTDHYEGVKLRTYLDQHSIEYSELARRLDKSKNTIQGYFKSETLGKANRVAILEALGATYEQVFGSSIVNPIDTTNVGSARLIRHVGNFSAEPIVVLPFVPVRARAGIPTAAYWEQPFETTRIMQATLADYESDPTKPRRSWWVIEVDGDSMEPQLRSRAKVLGYYIGRENGNGVFEIDREQLKNLKPGIWVIQYDEDFVIKRVRSNHIEQDGGLLLHSDNPPPDPFFIRADSIRHVWFIETVVNSPVR